MLNFHSRPAPWKFAPQFESCLPKNQKPKTPIKGVLVFELAWRESLRTTDWSKVFPYPTVSLQQINQLLAIV